MANIRRNIFLLLWFLVVSDRCKVSFQSVLDFSSTLSLHNFFPCITSWFSCTCTCMQLHKPIISLKISAYIAHLFVPDLDNHNSKLFKNLWYYFLHVVATNYWHSHKWFFMLHSAKECKLWPPIPLGIVIMLDRIEYWKWYEHVCLQCSL